MALFLWFTAAILTFHATQSYVLLTANLEDVQAIAKQLSQSPVADQLSKIWRRAADQFTVNLQKPIKPQAYKTLRSTNEEADQQANQGYPEMRSSLNDQPQDVSFNQRERSDAQQPDSYQNKDDMELVALGRNASRYLKSIRKIFEKD